MSDRIRLPKPDPEDHPGWDLPPVIGQGAESDAQPPGMDLPPGEWKKWKERFKGLGGWKGIRS